MNTLMRRIIKMKKIIVILLAVFLMSCGKEDTKSITPAPSTPTDCNCGEIVSRIRIQPGGYTTEPTRYIIKNNCTMHEKTFESHRTNGLPIDLGMGEEWCDNDPNFIW
jgi:hypothetical protein